MGLIQHAISLVQAFVVNQIANIQCITVHSTGNAKTKPIGMKTLLMMADMEKQVALNVNSNMMILDRVLSSFFGGTHKSVP